MKPDDPASRATSNTLNMSNNAAPIDPRIAASPNATKRVRTVYDDNLVDDDTRHVDKKMMLMTNFVEKPTKYSISIDDIDTGLPISIRGMYDFIGGDSTDPEKITDHPDFVATKAIVKPMKSLIKRMFKRLLECGQIIDECIFDDTPFSECVQFLLDIGANVIDGGDISESSTTLDALINGFIEIQLREGSSDGEYLTVSIGFHHNCTHFVTHFSNGVLFKMRFFNKMHGDAFSYPDIISAIHPQILIQYATISSDPDQTIHARIGNTVSVLRAIERSNFPQLEDLVVVDDIDDDDDDEDGEYESDFIDDDGDFEPDESDEDSGEDSDEDSDDTYIDPDELDDVGGDGEDEEDEEDGEDGEDGEDEDDIPEPIQKQMFWKICDFDAPLIPKIESTGHDEHDTMFLEFFDDSLIVFTYDS